MFYSAALENAGRTHKTKIMKLSELAITNNSTIENGSPDDEFTGAAGLDLADARRNHVSGEPQVHEPRSAKPGPVRSLSARDIEIVHPEIAVLRSDDAYVAYTLALRAFHPAPPLGARYSIRRQLSINPRRSAEKVQISANSVIGRNCVIKDGVRIFPNVTIYDGVTIGENYGTSIPE